MSAAPQLGAQAAFGTGNYTNFPSSSYNVLEGFGEVDAPLLKNNIVQSLDLSLAGRMTSYSTLGPGRGPDPETGRHQPGQRTNIKLRTTWSVDIRAPQLSRPVHSLLDQCILNHGSQDPDNQLFAFTLSLTGNPNLNPEVARTISGGVVLTPTFIRGAQSFSADWYSINVTGELGTVASATIINQCSPSQPSTIAIPARWVIPMIRSAPICCSTVRTGPLSQGLTSSRSILASQTVSGVSTCQERQLQYGFLGWNHRLDGCREPQR